MDADYKARRALLHLTKAVGDIRFALRILEIQTSLLVSLSGHESVLAETGTSELKSSLESIDASLAEALKIFDEPG